VDEIVRRGHSPAPHNLIHSTVGDRRSPVQKKEK